MLQLQDQLLMVLHGAKMLRPINFKRKDLRRCV